MNSQPESKQIPSSFLFIFAIIGLVWYVAVWNGAIPGVYNSVSNCATWTPAALTYLLPQPRKVPQATTVIACNNTAGFCSRRIYSATTKGLEDNLYENLESTFTQEYPNYEIILSVADEQDKLFRLRGDLISRYPNVTARIIVGKSIVSDIDGDNSVEESDPGEEVVGVNPKVNNLIRSYREATHDILWVIDSGVSVVPGTLARSVDLLEPSTPTKCPKRGIALIHHVPFASTPEEFFLGSSIEEAFLNTSYAKMYLAINTSSIEACVVGKSNLYRRSDIERVNGSLKPHTESNNGQSEGLPRRLAAFGKFMAEDYAIASALWHELDLRHDVSCDVAHTTIGKMSLSDYVWKRVRWIRVRKHMVLAADILEPFTESLVASFIAAASLRYLFGIQVLLFLVVHNAVWLWVDLDVYESLAGRPLAADKRWRFIGAWCLRELLALPIWVLAMLGNEVIWRGKRYEVFGAGEGRAIVFAGDRLLRRGTTLDS
ncbi:glycosyltransferase family 21 protein [Suillus lakei]|nr:glycosyltransferase family 21 protein [Suillus lakei]